MEMLLQNGTVPTCTKDFFCRQSGKLTEIGHEPEGLGTRLLCLAIFPVQPKNLKFNLKS